MKSDLTDMQIESLLDDAEDAWPDNDFVFSVRDWYEEHGFITENQESALQNIADRGR